MTYDVYFKIGTFRLVYRGLRRLSTIPRTKVFKMDEGSMAKRDGDVTVHCIQRD